jgi:hypothetical protein
MAKELPMTVVSLLPRLSLEASLRRNSGVRAVVFELQSVIDGIRSLRSDLEAYYWDCPMDGPHESRRFQIGHWIRLLSDRGAALESIVMQKGTSRLALGDVSEAEAKGLREAVDVLQQSIYDDDPFEHVRRLLTAALAAADRTGLRAAGGIPAGR